MNNLIQFPQISVFNFNQNDVNIQLFNDEPWFLASDICTILGYSNARDAIAKHVDIEDVAKRDGLSKDGKKRVMNWINESGLYALIFGSQLKEAIPFKRWVTSEVLPTIRRTGCYRAEREVLCEEFKQIIKEICGESLRNAWLDMLNSTDKDRQQSVFNQIALMFDMTVQAQVRKECEKRIEKMREIIYLPTV